MERMHTQWGKIKQQYEITHTHKKKKAFLDNPSEGTNAHSVRKKNNNNSKSNTQKSRSKDDKKKQQSTIVLLQKQWV